MVATVANGATKVVPTLTFDEVSMVKIAFDEARTWLLMVVPYNRGVDNEFTIVAFDVASV